jgi:hypothetical protein
MTDFRALCAELLEALENAIRVIYGEDGTKHISTADPVIAKAAAALAQPELQGPWPTDEELSKFATDWWNGFAYAEQGADVATSVIDIIHPWHFVGFLRDGLARCTRPAQPEPQVPGPTDEELHQLWLELNEFHEGPTSGEVAEIAHTALARWSRPAKPELQGPWPTDEELLGIEDLEAAWNAQADAFNSWDELGIDEIVCWAQRQALARWGRFAIEPVPVSERLPGPGDCDAEGRCWVGINLSVCEHRSWILDSIADNDSGCWLPYWALPVPKAEVGE